MSTQTFAASADERDGTNGGAFFLSSSAAFAEAAAKTLEVPDSFLEVFSDVSWAIFGRGALAFEHVMMTICPSLVEYLNRAVAEHGYESRKPLPMTSRPVDAIFCIFLYFVAMGVLYGFSKAVGKRSYKAVGLVHNAFLFSLSLYMGLGFLATAWASFDRPWNNPILDPKTDDNGWRMTKMFWVFAISKLPEYGDTFLMVLKQNYHQISFLHLYHHCSIWTWCYIAAIFGCGGDVYWSGMVNSWVHVAMYGYYAGTLAFKDGPIRRALNSIKFIITKGQITQFVLNMCQVFYVMLIAEKFQYPFYMMMGQIAYMSSMVILFANFLLKNQGKPDRRKKGKTAEEENQKKNVAAAADEPAGRAISERLRKADEEVFDRLKSQAHQISAAKSLSPSSSGLSPSSALSPSASVRREQSGGLSPSSDTDGTSVSPTPLTLSPSHSRAMGPSDSIRLSQSPSLSNVDTEATVLNKEKLEGGLIKRR